MRTSQLGPRLEQTAVPALFAAPDFCAPEMKFKNKNYQSPWSPSPTGPATGVAELWPQATSGQRVMGPTPLCQHAPVVRHSSGTPPHTAHVETALHAQRLPSRPSAPARAVKQVNPQPHSPLARCRRPSAPFVSCVPSVAFFSLQKGSLPNKEL